MTTPILFKNDPRLIARAEADAAFAADAGMTVAEYDADVTAPDPRCSDRCYAADCITRGRPCPLAFCIAFGQPSESDRRLGWRLLSEPAGKRRGAVR